jgi:hypothetical protein
MKASKTKVLNRKVKKQLKSDLEVNLKAKLKDFIVSLGHDAEDISTELKKASKLLAKKLAAKIKSVKDIKSEKAELKKAEVKVNTVKSAQKAKKVIAKAVKKVNNKAADIEEIIKKEVVNPAKVVLDDVQAAPKVTAGKTVIKKAPAPKVVATKKSTEKPGAPAKAAAVKTSSKAPAKKVSKAPNKKTE